VDVEHGATGEPKHGATVEVDHGATVKEEHGDTMEIVYCMEQHWKMTWCNSGR
jgi:hypothetical protein